MSILPRAPFERFLKQAGARRVSQDALEEFANFMDEKLTKIAAEASALAKHAGRKTIIAEDVRFAKKKIYG